MKIKYKLLLLFLFNTILSWSQNVVKQDSSIILHQLQYPIFKKSNNNIGIKNSKNSIKNNADEILDSISIENKKLKYTQGYRILVYSGFDKKLATNAKEILYKTLGDVEIYYVFKQPTYKVKLGDFNSWIDANFILNTKVIQNFPTALIVPDLINITYK